MIKYQSQSASLVETDGVQEPGVNRVIYIIEGEEAERQEFLANGGVLLENEKWLCPDSGKLYYWSKSQNTLKEFGNQNE